FLKIGDEVAAKQVDADRQVSPIVVARNCSFAIALGDFGNLVQRNLHTAGASQRQVSKGFGVVTEIQRETHTHVVDAVSHVDLSDRTAADAGLNQVGDIRDVDAIP